MSIYNQVKNSLNWKRSNEYCAKRLNISLEEYLKIKKQILNNKEKNQEEKVIESNINIEKGEGFLKGILNEEPLSAQEVEQKFKIDTKKWKLIQYWNKEKPGGGFYVSANIKSIENLNTSVIYSPVVNLKYIKQPVNLNEKYISKTCGIISLQDIHVGKKGITEYNVIEDVKKCVKTLLLRTYNMCFLDKVFFVLGGDLVNMDTLNGTTTKGTPVENKEDAYSSYVNSFELMYWCINIIKEYCNSLEIIYIPGNHSNLTEFHISYSLSKLIKDSNIIWNIDTNSRKAVKYGNNMFCFEHGDYDLKRSMFTFATEFSEIWGTTKYRTLYTGHYHKRKKYEYITEDELNGFTLKILPSLSNTDLYHYNNKWTNNIRSGVIELHSEEKGYIGCFNNNAS